MSWIRAHTASRPDGDDNCWDHAPRVMRARTRDQSWRHAMCDSVAPFGRRGSTRSLGPARPLTTSECSKSSAPWRVGVLPKHLIKETLRAPELAVDSTSKCYKGKVGKGAMGLTKDTWSPSTRNLSSNLKELPPGAGLPHAAARTISKNTKFLHSNLHHIPAKDRSPEGCKQNHSCKTVCKDPSEKAPS